MRRVLPLLVWLFAAAHSFAAVTGSVFDERGNALAQATVRVYRAEDDATRRERLLNGEERKPLFTTATSDEGTFSADVSGIVEIHVLHEGHAPRGQFALAGEVPAVFGLTAAPARTLKVVGEGKAVAGARVLAFDEMATMIELGATNDAGEIVVPDPRRWQGGLLVLHRQFAPAELATHSIAGTTIELARGKSVSGRVVDVNGKPVAKAILMSGMWPVGRSGDDGTFTVAMSDAPRVVALHANARGAGTGGDIRIEPSRSISGSATGPDGKPLVGLQVRVTAASRSPFDSTLVTAVTDEKGRFQADHLAPAQHHLFVLPVADLDIEVPVPAVDLRRSERATVAIAAKRGERLRGVVLDTRKKPVGGAMVSYLPKHSALAYLALDAPMNGSLTAADGSFRMQMPREATRLLVMHPRYAATVTEPIEGAQAQRKPLTIAMQDGIEVRGIVVDAEDKPVAGAGIAALQDHGASLPMPLESLVLTGNARALFESGADGTFRLRLNAAPHDIAVFKEGYAPSRVTGFEPGGDPLRIVLTRGVAIQGRVVRNGGAAVGEGQVFVRSENGVHRMAALGTDGSFAVTSLEPGRYSIGVMTLDGDVEERMIEAPASDVVLELPPTVTITGTVTDKASGTPVAHYSVHSDGAAATAEVEGGGPFSIEVPVGSVRITVVAPGYVDATREIVTEPGMTGAVDFALVRGRSIRGRVVDAGGKPIEGIRVLAAADTTYGDGSETGVDGEFQLDGLAPESVTIAFTGDGYVARNVEVPPGRNEPLEIVLGKGRSATGRVVTENGQPVENAQVSAESAVHGARPQSATTGADGSFRIEGLVEGRHTLRANKRGHREAELRDVDLTTSAPIVLVLRGEGATGIIRGVVSGFDARSLQGQISVRSTEDDRGWAHGVIARDGTYRIEDVPSGEVTVRAQAMSTHREMNSRAVTVHVPAGGEVEVNLAFSNDIVVRGVVTSNGQPAAARYVAFYGNAGSWRAFTDAQGRYEITGIEPGKYHVTILQSRAYQTTYEVTGSATFDIAADFARVEGRVVDSDGAPVAGAVVSVKVAADSWNSGDATTDASGAFAVDMPVSAARGQYEVSASKKGFATAVQKVDDIHLPMLLRLVRSEGIPVRLVDARDGATLGGYVVARNARGEQLGRVSEQENDGTMRVAVLQGSYRISASANGYATQTVLATAPSTSELRIALTPGGTLIVRTERDATELVKLVQPNGEEYVRCECNGIAEIRLTGRTTRIEHIAPGTYEMRVIGAGGKVLTSVPVQVAEGGTAVVDVKW